MAQTIPLICSGKLRKRQRRKTRPSESIRRKIAHLLSLLTPAAQVAPFDNYVHGDERAAIHRDPQYLLHGHEPLTRNFRSPSVLVHLKEDHRGCDLGPCFRASAYQRGTFSSAEAAEYDANYFAPTELNYFSVLSYIHCAPNGAFWSYP